MAKLQVLPFHVAAILENPKEGEMSEDGCKILPTQLVRAAVVLFEVFLTMFS
jgi:hypothetical protein